MWRLNTPQGICEISVITLIFCLQCITGIYAYFLSTDYTDFTVCYSWYLRYVEAKHSAMYLWNQCNHIGFLSPAYHRDLRLFFYQWITRIILFLLYSPQGICFIRLISWLFNNQRDFTGFYCWLCRTVDRVQSTTALRDVVFPERDISTSEGQRPVQSTTAVWSVNNVYIIRTYWV